MFTKHLEKIVFSLAALFFIAIVGTASAETIMVRHGDTLSQIANQHNTSVDRIVDENDISNPDLIFPGQEIKIGSNEPQRRVQLGAAAGSISLDRPFPEDNYDTFLTAPVSSGDSKIFVNEVPSVDNSIYTIYESDGRTVSEKIHCTGVTTTPTNALTNCTRDISATPNSDGSIDEISQSNGTSHSKNARIAITNNINFTGKGLAMLFGNQTSSLKVTDKTLTVVSNTLFIGDNTTNTGKKIVSRNGEGNQPFIRYNESQNFWEFSENGIDTIRMNSTTGDLVASSTSGIGIDSSEIYAKVSSTKGLTFDGDGNIYNKVSSTKGIGFDNDGAFQLKTDTSRDLTFNNNGEVGVDNVTSTPSKDSIVRTPTSSRSLPGSWFIYGDGNDGNVTIGSGTTTISEDKHYTSLTIKNGAVLDTNDYRVYVSGKLMNSGTIMNNGEDGTDGADGVAGSGGNSGGTGGTLVSGVDGGDGGGSGENGGSSGENGVTTTVSLGTKIAASGGEGGDYDSNNKGSPGGKAGGIIAQRDIRMNVGFNNNIVNTATNTLAFAAYPELTSTSTISKIKLANNPSSGGGGGGGCNLNNDEGGGGGGAGGTGGIVFIVAQDLVNKGTIESNGGNGGDGGHGGNCGGGGGGAGGNGGVVILWYDKYTNNGTIQTLGGTGGTGGGGSNNPGGSSPGEDGNKGEIYKAKIK